MGTSPHPPLHRAHTRRGAGLLQAQAWDAGMLVGSPAQGHKDVGVPQALGRLGVEHTEAWRPGPGNSRGVGAALIRAGAIHVERDLLPFAAAIVGVQGVDGHLKLYL